jgi:hypothetical protein
LVVVEREQSWPQVVDFLLQGEDVLNVDGLKELRTLPD